VNSSIFLLPNSMGFFGGFFFCGFFSRFSVSFSFICWNIFLVYFCVFVIVILREMLL